MGVVFHVGGGITKIALLVIAAYLALYLVSAPLAASVAVFMGQGIKSLITGLLSGLGI